MSEPGNSPLRLVLRRCVRRGAGRAVPWLPFAALLAWLVWAGLAGTLRLDLWHALGLGLLGAAALAGRRLWTPALVVALLLAPMAWHFAVRLPAAREALAADPGFVRLEGTVRARRTLARDVAPRERDVVQVLLGEVTVWRGDATLPLAEAVVVLPARSAWHFRRGRRLRLAGGPEATAVTRHRLWLVFDARPDYHFRGEPVAPWSNEVLRTRLRDRAAYYLDKPALAVYLPVLLGVRERTDPEAREVTGAFRRVGISHLFAISGLHVGLLFVLFWAGQHAALRWLLRGQGWVHARTAGRVAVMGLIWGYIALIGFPVPAVRAALMGTMLVWAGLWGTRASRYYVLGLAGLLFLAHTPSLVYDLSFQLSFLAYLCLVLALEQWPPWRPAAGERGPGRPRWLHHAAAGTGLNLWLTLFITLGLWPLVAATFGQVSLLVFAGNLVMVPLLAGLVLPAGLAGLGASLLHLGAPPGAWLERVAFGVLEPVLSAWVGIARTLDRLGGPLVLQVDLDWTPRAFFAYYAVLVAVALAVRRWRATARRIRSARA